QVPRLSGTHWMQAGPHSAAGTTSRNPKGPASAGYHRSVVQAMSMTDPIADMLTRIRNAVGSKHRRVDIPASKMKVEIARLLKESNFINDYKTLETPEGKKILRVSLK